VGGSSSIGAHNQLATHHRQLSPTTHSSCTCSSSASAASAASVAIAGWNTGSTILLLVVVLLLWPHDVSSHPEYAHFSVHPARQQVCPIYSPAQHGDGGGVTAQHASNCSSRRGSSRGRSSCCYCCCRYCCCCCCCRCCCGGVLTARVNASAAHLSDCPQPDGAVLRPARQQHRTTCTGAAAHFVSATGANWSWRSPGEGLHSARVVRHSSSANSSSSTKSRNSCSSSGGAGAGGSSRNSSSGNGSSRSSSRCSSNSNSTVDGRSRRRRWLLLLLLLLSRPATTTTSSTTTTHMLPGAQSFVPTATHQPATRRTLAVAVAAVAVVARY
jgi:hypothetical protein